VSVLLVAATELEIRESIARYQNHAGVDVLVTGMGMVATTYSLTHHLQRSGPYDLVVQGGVAGAMHTGIELGQVVRVEREILVDFGAEDRDGRTLAPPELGLAYPYGFTEAGVVKLVAKGFRLPYRSVLGGTVQRGSGNADSIERIRRQYPEVEVESMEGAALAYTCARLSQPAIQLRAISNYVTERARDSWKLPLAINRLNESLIEFIDSL
jgi:futalosine hydrolase